MAGQEKAHGLQLEYGLTIPGDRQGAEALAKSKAVANMEPALKKELRQDEDLNKKALLEREKENFTNIFALKCYNGWLKFYNNSAVIVSVWLDGKLGKTYNRNNDQGYGVKAEYGVVSVPPDGVSDIIQRFAKAKIPLSFDGEWMLEFQLGDRVSKEDMMRMLHEDELIIDRVNKLVLPKEILPGLRADIKTLLNFVHTEVRNHKETVKSVFLNDMERRAVEANRLVIATSRGRVKLDDCLNEIGQFTEDMYEYATTASDICLITARQYKEFVDLIKRVENEQAREIKRQIARKTEKELTKAKRKK